MDPLHFETKAIRNQLERTQYREHSVPVFLTSSFTFPTAEEMRDTFAGETEGIIYSRYSNPNTDEFIQKICTLEGVEDGFATASGMSAVFVSMAAFLEAGDHVLVSRAVFGSTHQIVTQILSKWGIEHTYLDPTNMENWAAEVRPNSKMLVLETPSNPTLRVLDLEAVGQFAKAHKLLLNVDNCFATPYLQQPAKFGADLVVHSATKFIDGQGRVLGGVVCGKPELIEKVRFFARHTGPALSPFHAWVLSKSLETLAIRMDRHCANAHGLATRLQDHKQAAKVIYPFLESHPQHDIAKKQMKLGGALLTFEIEGGLEAGQRFLNAIQLCSLTSNLGDARTIVTHPASTTHSKLSDAERQAAGITPGLVRISVGLEHIDDIWNDIDQALAKAK